MVRILIVLLVLIGLFVVRTVMVEHSATQKEFDGGRVPAPLPDGFYKGSVSFPHGGWKGKSFSAKSGTGINILGDANEQRYPFKTYVAKGLRDPTLDVLRIDYSDPVNSWWLRRIVDEIVQVGEQKYLGKVHLKVIPGFPFTIGFFRLEK